MNAVNSGGRKIGYEIVQQAERAQSGLYAVKRIGPDALDQVPLEIESGQRVERLEGLGTGRAGQFADGVLRQIEERQGLQASQGFGHFFLSRALQVEILEGFLESAKGPGREGHLVVGQLEGDEFEAVERVVVDSGNLVHRQIENCEILQHLQRLARQFRQFVVLKIEALQ